MIPKMYQENFHSEAIDETLIFIEKLPTEEEQNLIKKYIVIDTKSNTMDMIVLLTTDMRFIMQIKEGLEEYKVNKIKVTIKMYLLKTYKNPIPEEKETLYIEQYEPEHDEKLKEEYLKYTTRMSANIFQLSKLDQTYIQYFITHTKNEELDNNTKTFVYMIFDKFLDYLTKLPNGELLEKVVSNNKEALFNLKANQISIKTIQNGYLLFIDLNNLKAMNDIYGHNDADILLQEFANYFKEYFPESAHFRIGGDEFVSVSETKEEIVKLSEALTSIEFSNHLKQKIEEKIKKKIDENILFFGSNGYVKIDLSNNNLKNLKKTAEEKMYLNKNILHLKYGIYDRRGEASGGTVLSGKLELENIEKILSSTFFNKMTINDKNHFLNNIKKISLELDKIQGLLKITENEEEIKTLELSLSKILEQKKDFLNKL